MSGAEREYAFDVKLFAVVRVTAPDQETAIKKMRDTIQTLSPADLIDSELSGGPRVTELSISEDGEDENAQPFEIDGVPQ